MKKYVCALLCILLLLSLTGCGRSEEPEFYVSQYKMENFISGTIQEMAHTYDDQWRSVLLETHFNGELVLKQETQYSEDNATVTMTMHSGGETSVSESHREFDENGNVIKLETTMDGEPYSTSYREYDINNRLIHDTTTYFSGYTQSMKVTYSYDPQGNLTSKVTESSADGTVITSRTDYAYDSQNRCTMEFRFQDDEVTGYYEYTYNGPVKTAQILDSGSSTFGRQVSTYDKWGNLLTMEAYNENDTLIYRQSYSYIGTDGTVVNAIE